MKRSIEMLGILFVFAFFCPFSAEAVASGDGYAYQNGEGYAYEWSGEPEDISPKYSYSHSHKSANEDGEGNGYAYENGEGYGHGVLIGELLDEITPVKFNYSFKNQGLEHGPFELMNGESLCQPEDAPIKDRKGDPQPVPEPCTMLLLAVGGSLLFSRRKR